MKKRSQEVVVRGTPASPGHILGHSWLNAAGLCVLLVGIVGLVCCGCARSGRQPIATSKTQSPAQAQQTTNGAVAGLTPKFIDAGGIRTRYYEMGQGEPLVLIHGGGANSPNSANIWSKNIRPLAEHFRVIAPDRLGNGMTGGTFVESLNFQDQANWLYNFLTAMHLSQVNLVGHSAGGAVVSWFAVDHPEMIKTLVVMDAGGPEPPGAHPGPNHLDVEMRSCPTQPLFAAQKCRFELLSYDPQRAFDVQWWAAQQYLKNWRDEHFKIPNTSPLTANMGSVTPQSSAQRQSVFNKLRNDVLGNRPVLLVYGKQDPFDWSGNAPNANLRGPNSMFDVVGAKDPNVQLLIINDAGHFVMRDEAGEFDSDLTNFLDYWNHQPAD